MESRSGGSHFLLPFKKLRTTNFLGSPLETWALVLVLTVVMVLSAIALGACWDSVNTDQTFSPYQDLGSVLIGHHQDFEYRF